MKWIDLPPVWLLACLVASWLFPVTLMMLRVPWLAAGLLIVAVGLTLAAVMEFARARTTVIPRQTPTALISSGVFRFSRNPIYLADLLFLAGLSFWFGNVTGLVLVPALAFILQHRFILKEEERLQGEFGEEFESYRARTRRWM